MNTRWRSDKRLPIGIFVMVFFVLSCKDRTGEPVLSGDPVDIEVQSASPNQLVLSRQATVKPGPAGGNAAVIAQGYIIPDPNRNHAVAARISGRIEKLYSKFSGQKVNRGDKIMDLYSPGMLTFQEEHLFLIRSNSDKTLIENSRKKLTLLGMQGWQIDQLEKNGTVAQSISIYSPENGFVFFDYQTGFGEGNTNKPVEGNSMNMPGNEESSTAFPPVMAQIREGSYINAGQVLFNVNDLREVWALVSISERYVDQLALGQSALIAVEDDPTKMVNGKIILIEPAFEDTDQRFVRVRIALSNPDHSLKINTLVSAQLTMSGKSQLMVPSSAVYRTGRQAFVWVKTDTSDLGTGIFQLKKVIAGPVQNGYIPITGGLKGDEEIAKEAGLMSDSETFLNSDEYEAN